MSALLRKPPGTQRNVKGRNKTVLFFLRLWSDVTKTEKARIFFGKSHRLSAFAYGFCSPTASNQNRVDLE